MKPLPLIPCSAVSTLSRRIYWPDGAINAASPTHSFASPKASKVRAAEWVLKELDKALEADRQTHESNDEAITNNLSIKHKIEETMASLGIGPTFSAKDEKSRKQIKPWITVNAGYVQDIARLVKTRDGWESAQSQYETLKKSYTHHLAEAQREESAAMYKAEQEQNRLIAKRTADMKLATILIRYSLPIESSWDDVLEALLAKNERLALAVAMEQVRSDFSLGPKHVLQQLFEPSGEVDKLIRADVLEAASNWDGDGRVFRDIAWNCDAIYNSIEDQQLVADAQLALAESSRH